MIVGPRNCGKTSLANRLNRYTGPLRKTQDTIYGKYTIDVPSAFLENTDMYKHLIALSQDAWCALIMVNQERIEHVYSHAFANALLCPSFGVIGKSDLAPENEAVCVKQLQTAGAREPYFRVNLLAENGTDELEEFLREFYNERNRGLDEIHNRK